MLHPDELAQAVAPVSVPTAVFRYHGMKLTATSAATRTVNSSSSRPNQGSRSGRGTTGEVIGS